MRAKGLILTASDASKAFFLLGVFLKQFYIASSGGFQIGDFCFMMSFLIMMILVNRGRIPIDNDDILIIIFVGCIIIINCIYYYIYGNDYSGQSRFQLSIIYYIYNFFIILTFRQFCSDRGFLEQLRYVLQTALLLQIFVWMAGLGRYFGYGRYMGTFNDPNQCGFYVFSSYLLIFIVSRITKKGHPLIWFVFAFYLIMKTVSTGMLLGMTVLLVVYLFIKINELNKQSSIAFIIIIGGLLVLIAIGNAGLLRLPDSIVSSTMYERVIGKIGRFGIGSDATASDGLRNLFVDRCWDRLLDYPIKMLYGAGEGYFQRFPSAQYRNNEIHSSFLGPLFYYGILPFTIWMVWIIKQIKGIKKELWAAFIALIAESITLANNRQPFFWMILVLFGSCLAKKGNAIDSLDRTEITG